jgi:hypothetical protein
VGECNYYLQARFVSPQVAEEALPKLVSLLGQGQEAYDYRQGSRDIIKPAGKRPTPKEFWTHFQEAFPLVTRYLGKLVGIENWNIGLAGQLGCLVRSDAQRAHLQRQGDVLRLTLRDIWHCTEMDRLERFFTAELGALVVNWASEERLEEEVDFDSEEGRFDEFFDPFSFIPV